MIRVCWVCLLLAGCAPREAQAPRSTAATTARPGFDCPENICVPRGRFDDGAYLTIEPSSLYEGFRPNSYVVIAAGGKARSGAVPTTLTRRALGCMLGAYNSCLHVSKLSCLPRAPASQHEEP